MWYNYSVMKILHIGQRGRSGFTLIEMTIVLVIILIFLAMSLPFFANFSTSTGLNTAKREVGTILRTARSYAISRNENYDAYFNATPNPDAYSICRTAVPTVSIDKTYQLPAGVSFSATTTVTFTPNGGLASGSPTSVTIISAQGVSKQITVDNATGAVTIP